MNSLPDIVLSADGPMSRDTGPAVLAHLLVEFEAAVSQAGVDVKRVLRQGLGAEEIVGRLADSGLSAPPEVVTLFSWHDGLNPDQPHCLPRFPMVSLETAIERQRIHVAATSPIGPEADWGRGEGWLGLTFGPWGYSVDCRTKSDAPLVRFAEVEFYAYPEKYRAVSLCTVFTWLIEGIRSGAHVWNPHSQEWVTDESKLPSLQVASSMI